jgi:hypothetical protein
MKMHHLIFVHKFVIDGQIFFHLIMVKVLLKFMLMKKMNHVEKVIVQ